MSVDVDKVAAQAERLRPFDAWRDYDKGCVSVRVILLSDIAAIRSELESVVGAVPAMVARIRELEKALGDAIDLSEEGWLYADVHYRDRDVAQEKTAALRLKLGGKGGSNAG